MNSNEQKFLSKHISTLSITLACSSFTPSYADIVWTDADFTSPKGQTSLWQENVQINNTETVKFEANLPTNIAVLSIEQGISFTVEKSMEVKTTGDLGDALLILGGSNVHVKGDLYAENIPSTNPYYVIAARDNNSTLQVDDKTTIKGQRGLYASNGSSIFLNGDTTIDATYNGATAAGGELNLNNTHININGATDNISTGLTSTGGRVNMNGTLGINLKVNTPSNYTYGVISEQQATINLKDTNITFTNDGNTGREVGLFSSGNSQLNVDGNLTILSSDASKSTNYSVYANGGQITSANSVANITGRIHATNNGQINLDMNSGSYWKGRSSIASSGGQIDINMDETRWDMTDDSTLTNLDSTKSNIYFLSSNPDFFTLTLDKLAGSSNNFHMNTDLGSISSTVDSNGERVGEAGVNGDLLVISGNNSSTNNALFVTNNGASNTQGNEVLQIVSTTPNNNGDFKLASAVEAGGYQYGLRQSNDPAKNGWELFGTGETSTTAKAAVNSYFNVSYLLSYIDNQTLLQRMGELRENQGKQGSFWMRAYGGKLNSFGGQKLDGFDMAYAGTQLGIDKQLQLNSGDLYLGLMTSYVKADPDYKAGSGTAKSFSTGGYLTYLDNNGFYFDTVLKYTNVRNKFSVRDTQNNSVQGHTQSNGYGLSFEFGRQFKLAKSNFYIEPQLQLAYQYQDGDKASATNGLVIKMDSYDSVLGRASGIVGYKVADSKNLQLNLYAKTGIVQEFAGDTSYRLNGNKEKYTFNGAWFDNGIGVNAKINNRHNFYGELDYSTGHRFDKAQASIGYRFEF